MNNGRYKTTYQTIYKYPGLTAREVGELMGVSRDLIYNDLMTCEQHGLLLSEDDYGRLYVYENNPTLA